MSYVLDPAVLREVAQAHLESPLETMFEAITQDLAQRYPGKIDTGQEWFFNNAGGAMGQLTILYASLKEYLIFFGTPIGTEGHTGRYSFIEDYAFVLDGEMWYFKEGQLKREVYVAGDQIHLVKSEAKGYRIPDHAWILEYARGPIPMMLPFGLADTMSSTLDFTTLARTFRIYGRHVARNLSNLKPRCRP